MSKKHTHDEIVEALRTLAEQADEDTPFENRRFHFRQALYDALVILEDEDEVERHTYANLDSLYSDDGDSEDDIY